MSVAEILEQVKTLSLAERKEVAKAVIDLLDAPVQAQRYKTGAEITAMLEAMEAPIELVDPEIEDPVEWVRQIRRDEQEQRLGEWGEDDRADRRAQRRGA